MSDTADMTSAAHEIASALRGPADTQAVHPNRLLTVEELADVLRIPARTLHDQKVAMRLADLGLGLRGFALCVLNLYTGARWSELVGQQRHEYDPVGKTITIRHPLREHAGRVTKTHQTAATSPESRVRRRRKKASTATKTPAGARTVFLPPGLAEVYEHLLASHDHEFVLAPAHGHTRRRSNCTQRSWRPVWDGSEPDDPRSDEHVPAVLSFFSFHEGRHSHNTWLTEDGVPEVARRARLGQKMKASHGSTTT